MSFLQRLKNRGVRSGQSTLQSESEETAVDKVAQLDVDVYQTEDKIIIYAQAAGADMNDVNVSIEGDADIVLIEGNIFWGGDIETIRELIRSKKILNSQIRLFLGYSGWSPGQLEHELKEDSWVIAKVKPDIVMNSRGDDTWKRVLRGFTNKYRMWAEFPESPEMN